MRIINVVLTASVVFIGMSAPGARANTFQTSEARVDDHTLESRIDARIKADADLAGYKIGVDLDNGVATIDGTVRTESQRARAQRLATIPGVTRVRNEIVVDATATPKTAKAGDGKIDRAAAGTQAGTDKALDKAKGGADVAVDKTKEGASKAVDATKKAVDKTVGGASAAKEGGKNAGEKIGEAFSDGWITTKVKAKIVDDGSLKGSDIKVETTDHVVTLKGTVTSTAAKAHAEALAGMTDGVTRVISLLTIAGK